MTAETFWFIFALFAIPFVLVYLIVLIATGSPKKAFKSGSIVILAGLLIGFIALLISV